MKVTLLTAVYTLVLLLQQMQTPVAQLEPTLDPIDLHEQLCESFFTFP